MKERYQEIDEKNETLRDYLGIFKDKSRDFLEKFEMSWIYHDAALEGTRVHPAGAGVGALPRAGEPWTRR